MKHSYPLLLGILATFPASSVLGQSVGLNLGSDRADALLGLDEVAGVVPQNNWNNLGPTTGGPLVLNDSTGTATAMKVTWAADEAWSLADAALDADGKLLKGFFSENNNGGENSSFTITGIPFASYDLYIYVSHDRAAEDVILAEESGAFPDFTAIENDTPITAAVTWTRQPVSAVGNGNYVLFPALTRSDLKIILRAAAGGSIDRNAISGIQIVNATAGDSDGDGLDDAWEVAYGLDPSDNGLDGSGNPIPGNPNGAAGDPDLDGSPNSREFAQKSFPDNDDSDGDTLLDGVETGGGVFVDLMDRGTNPVKADTDGDTLNDNVETNTGVVADPLTDTGTNPNKADTDADTLRDDWEIRFSLDPADNGTLNPENGAEGDPDADGLSNADEQARGTDPRDGDTDDDDLADGVESNDGNFVDATATGTNPLLSDTDGDLLSDGDEVNTTGTNPNLSDSDGDNLRDDWELSNGFNPLVDGDNALTGGGIGLNFGAGRADASLLPADLAGAFPQANWNNLAGAALGPLALVDDAGSETGAMVKVTMDEEWSVGGPGADPDGVLLTGWFAAQNNNGTNTIDISDIPYANYDLILYFNHDRVGETTDVAEANEAFPLFTTRENDPDTLNATIWAQQVESNGPPNDDRGNFAIISGLSASTLNLIVNAGTVGVERGPLTGMQLVNRGNTGITIASIVVDRVAGTVDLTWTSQTGRRYSIDSGSDLIEANWLELEDDIEATGTTATRRLSGIDFTTRDRQFFRVRLVQ